MGYPLEPVKSPDEPYGLETEDKIDSSLVVVAGEEWRLLYDALGRVTTAVIFADGRESGRLAFHYDVAGHIAQIEKTGTFSEKTLFLVLDAVYANAVILGALPNPYPVLVGNWPLTFAATQSGLWNVGINNWPLTYAAVQSGIWSVGVNNFPATYDVSDRAGRLLGIITCANLDVALSTRLADAKFPATQALADNLANPTVTGIGSYNLVWNSVTSRWERLNTHGSGAPLFDLTFISDTGLTGRDWSLDFKTLTDAFLTDAFRQNLKYVNGTAQTARDWSLDFASLVSSAILKYGYPPSSTSRDQTFDQLVATASWTQCATFTPANNKSVYLVGFIVGLTGATTIATQCLSIRIQFNGVDVFGAKGVQGFQYTPTIPMKLNLTGDGIKTLDIDGYHAVGSNQYIQGTFQLFEI